MKERTFIEANDLLIDSFKLSVKIFDDGFKPDFLVGLWRGGSAVGIAVQEGLEYLGVETDHISVRTSYAGRGEYSKRLAGERPIRVHGLSYLLDRVESGHSMLIVDDVYSTGHSVKAVIDSMSTHARRNLPGDIRIASVYYRPMADSERPPDYYVHESNNWLVLPYELADMSAAEIREFKPELAPILDDLSDRLSDN